MNAYKINKATAKDSGLISELICELLKDFNQQSGSNFVIDASKIEDTCKELLPRENFAGFIAIDSRTNQTAGMITIAQGTAIYNGGDFGVITELYVDRNIRSKGIGKLLIQSALEFARTKNWKKVEVGAPAKSNGQEPLNSTRRMDLRKKGPNLV
ncbi:GNAT family N-acetyltransferase [Flavobacterium limi]|uniref:N-acetyltransferase domain-containing protein n=1 Tax=Flavobacterium limi TaxID=2045105 RepID=A0ABQ1UVI7_9FLAO|nr:GNAT family N-acetyltransferase [Flavobacterium limi]GGF28080.1 hypothetical protein GCM10011518_41730 [Flavobacterium limi]